MTPVLCFVGRSNTGKTTVIERLIPMLKAKGITVATIKHHNHPFEIDYEGKDTYRHKAAGARTAMIVSSRKFALVKDLDRELSLTQIVAQYADDVDLVIVEGYKAERLPKIEVYNFREHTPPVAADDANLLALISDIEVPARVPVFLRDDIQSIAAFVFRELKLGR